MKTKTGTTFEDFPRHSLEEAYSSVVRPFTRSGGRALPTYTVALATGRSPASSEFRVKIVAAAKYGLVLRRGRDIIELTDAGTALVAPRDEAEYASLMLAAATQPPLFHALHERYLGRRLPAKEQLASVLQRGFDLSSDTARDSARIFWENVEFLSLAKRGRRGRYLTNEAKPPGRLPSPLPVSPENTESGKIFISHGGSRRAAEELLGILAPLRIAATAIDTDTTQGGAVSPAVLDALRKARAAVFILSRNPTQNVNVFFELGAAAAILGDRILVLVEKGADTPASVASVPQIDFEPGQLASRRADLLLRLVDLGVLKVGVT